MDTELKEAYRDLLAEGDRRHKAETALALANQKITKLRVKRDALQLKFNKKVGLMGRMAVFYEELGCPCYETAKLSTEPTAPEDRESPGNH